jgi:hypothetical protein
MFSSLPDYRRFAETALQRLRTDAQQKTSRRVSGIVINVALLAGLWGLPLYARRIVLTDLNSTPPLPEAIVGEWQVDQRNSLVFKRDHELRLIQNDALIELADYRIVEDVLEVSGFSRWPDNRPLPVVLQRYRISIRGHHLIVTSASNQPNQVPEIEAEEGSSLRRVLPAFPGRTVQFLRADSR